MRLAVVGAGAIGGTIGAYLVRAGRDVTFVDVVAEHVDAIRARGLLPFLTEDGCVVSLQNGLDEVVIESIVGRQRTVGSFVNFGAEYQGPGVIHFGGRGTLVLGELDGNSTPRLDALDAIAAQEAVS